LVEVTEDDLQGNGHFAALGWQVGIGRVLNLDEGLAYSFGEPEN
jgi:hypothetical protein